MHAPGRAKLLDLWERGAQASHSTRGVLLLGAAMPELEPAALWQASIGHRDAWLLSLREALFGSRIECLTACAACSAAVELGFDVSDVRAIHATPHGQCEVRAEGRTWRFRVPNSADLRAVEVAKDIEDAEQHLLARCWIRGGEHEQAWPQPVGATLREAIATALCDADPQAEVLLAVACPACGLSSLQLFDIVAHLWTELDVWARNTLNTVDLIASRYGWSEASILAMSPARSRAYFDIIVGAA